MILLLPHVNEEVSIQTMPPLFPNLEPWADGMLTQSQQDQAGGLSERKVRKPKAAQNLPTWVGHTLGDERVAKMNSGSTARQGNGGLQRM